MTLIIQKPTGAKLNLAQTYVGIDDPDAAVYVAAVEAADGQSLETATKVAIHSFVKGCKADGVWPAIKASCILAGARTLTGALLPLVGTAPTNNNFVSGDYNRKTGLVGNGSDKSLNSNRNNNADPQNSKHVSVYVSQLGTAALLGSGAGGGNGVVQLREAGLQYRSRNNESATEFIGATPALGLFGTSRSLSSSYVARNAITTTVNNASVSPNNENIVIFNISGLTLFTNARLAFYSIGESLDLALLDARVTDLINAFAAAIP
jgi:hypothetical protein